MVYDAGKKLTRKEIDLFRDAEDIRQITFLGTRLADERCKYDPKRVAEYASKQGYAQKLGYLVDITLQACENMRFTDEENIKRLKKLIMLLSPHINGQYNFLFPGDSDLLKKLTIRRSNLDLNKKWHTYSDLRPIDIEEYIELYLIDLRQGNYVRYGPDTIRLRNDDY